MFPARVRFIGEVRWQFLAFSLVVISAVFWCLFGRSVSWGWVEFDDKALVYSNEHLAGWHWETVKWALTDTDFGRRWTPVLWLVAMIPGCKSAVGYHLLVLGLGWLLSCLLFVWFCRSFDAWFALLLALVFVCNPMRWEIFGWNMGFVYETCGICCVASCLVGSGFWCLALAALGVLCYPISAGVLLIQLWRCRRSWWCTGFGVGLVCLAVFQYSLRVRMGFIPMHYRWDVWWWSICHYVLSFAFPWVTSPVFPAGYYPLLAVGAGFVGLWAALHWRSLAVCLVVFSPVLAAGVTESFWYGARYSVLFTMVCLWFFGRLLKWSGSGLRAGVLLVVVCVLGGFLVEGDDLLAHGNIYALERTIESARFVGVNTDIYKMVLGRLTPSERAAMRKYPLLRQYLTEYDDYVIWYIQATTPFQRVLFPRHFDDNFRLTVYSN